MKKSSANRYANHAKVYCATVYVNIKVRSNTGS
nr:MAG TPA: hypothetical protein [Caudoviricetes sp.]